MKTVVTINPHTLHKLFVIGTLINKTTLKPLIQLSRSFNKYHFTIPSRKSLNLKEYNYKIYPFELSFMNKFKHDIYSYQKTYLYTLEHLFDNYLTLNSALVTVSDNRNELRKSDYAVVYHLNDYVGLKVIIDILDNVNSKIYTICGERRGSSFIKNEFKVYMSVYNLPESGKFIQLDKAAFDDIIADLHINDYNNLTKTMLRSVCYACDLNYKFYENECI